MGCLDKIAHFSVIFEIYLEALLYKKGSVTANGGYLCIFCDTLCVSF